MSCLSSSVFSRSLGVSLYRLLNTPASSKRYWVSTWGLIYSILWYILSGSKEIRNKSWSRWRSAYKELSSEKKEYWVEIETVSLSLVNKLFILTVVYWIYTPVSPVTLVILGISRLTSLVISPLVSLIINADTANFCAICLSILPSDCCKITSAMSSINWYAHSAPPDLDDIFLPFCRYNQYERWIILPFLIHQRYSPREIRCSK